jgi:hypothetical protein
MRDGSISGSTTILESHLHTQWWWWRKQSRRGKLAIGRERAWQEYCLPAPRRPRRRRWSTAAGATPAQSASSGPALPTAKRRERVCYEAGNENAASHEARTISRARPLGRRSGLVPAEFETERAARHGLSDCALEGRDHARGRGARPIDLRQKSPRGRCKLRRTGRGCGLMRSGAT